MTTSLHPTMVKLIVKDSIRKSGFLNNVSENRLAAIVNNNVDMIFGPSTKFKPSSTLAVATEHFSTAFKQEPTEATLQQLLLSKHSVLGSKVIDATIASFQDSLKATKEELETFKSTVQSLMSKYSSAVRKYANAETLVPSFKDTALTYEDWGCVAHLGPENLIISEVHAASGMTTEEPNLTLFSSYVNKLTLNMNHFMGSLAPVAISEERKNTIAAAIASTSGLDLKTSTETFVACSSSTGMNHFINKLNSMVKAPNSKTVIEAIELSNAIARFFTGYDKVIVAQEDKETFLDNATVKANVAMLKDVHKALTYYLCYYRYSAWKNMVILPTGKINMDKKDEALSSGITKDDLRLFLAKTNFTSGFHNITADYIQHNKAGLHKMHETEVTNARMRISTDQTAVSKAAFQTTVDNYLRERDKIKGLGHLGVAICNETFNLKKSPEYGFYKIVMEEKAASPTSRQLFDELGKGFSALSQSIEEPKKRDIEETQAAVITKFITNFIVKTFC